MHFRFASFSHCYRISEMLNTVTNVKTQEGFVSRLMKRLQTSKDIDFHHDLTFTPEHIQHHKVQLSHHLAQFEYHQQLVEYHKSLVEIHKQWLAQFDPSSTTTSTTTSTTSTTTSTTPTPATEPVPESSFDLQSKLQCQHFVCLLSKYDLLKTSNGYILRQEPSEFNVESDCQSFSCWLSQYKLEEKDFGFELISTTSSNITDEYSPEMMDDSEIFQFGVHSLEEVPEVEITSSKSKTINVQENGKLTLNDFYSNYDY